MAVDYMGYVNSVKNPMESAIQGFGTGLQMKNVEQTEKRNNILFEQQQQQRNVEIEQQKMKLQQARQMQEDLIGLSQNPNASAAEYASVANKHPNLASHLKQTYELMDEDRRKTTSTEAINVFTALKGGNVDIATKILQDKRDAAKNSGMDDEANKADSLLKLIEINPEAATTSAGLFLASTMKPEKFTETFTSLQKNERDERVEKANLMKTSADLGLKNAQTRKALADVEKTDIQTQKAILELEALKSGKKIIGADKKFAAESSIRKEFTKNTDNHKKVEESFRRINSAQDSAVGDIAMIFSYMKMLDPASTVREGEFASAQNAAGVPDRVFNIYNNVISGERLNEGQRRSFKKQASGLYNASNKTYEDLKSGLTKVIDNYGLNKDNIFVDKDPENVDVEGIDDDYYSKLSQVESAGGKINDNPNSSATGKYQFMPETWDAITKKYGMTNKDINDPIAQDEAVKYLTDENKQHLSQKLNREPTKGELYLAHQQGATGATKILNNPDKKIIDIIGREKAMLNLPKQLQGNVENMTAKEFADYWTGKFDISTRGYMKYAGGGNGG